MNPLAGVKLLGRLFGGVRPKPKPRPPKPEPQRPQQPRVNINDLVKAMSVLGSPKPQKPSVLRPETQFKGKAPEFRSKVKDVAVGTARSIAKTPETVLRSGAESYDVKLPGKQVNDPVRKFLYGNETKQVKTYQERAKGVKQETKNKVIKKLPAEVIGLGLAGLEAGLPKKPKGSAGKGKGTPSSSGLTPRQSQPQSRAPSLASPSPGKVVPKSQTSSVKAPQGQPQAGKVRLPSQKAGQVPVTPSPRTNVRLPSTERPLINVGKYSISSDARQKISDVAEGIRPEIDAKVGQKLSLKEVERYAKGSGKGLGASKTREQTLKSAAAMKNARDTLARLSAKSTSGQALSQKEQAEFVKQALNVKTTAADLARQLGSLRTSAKPNERTMLDVVITKLHGQVKDLDALTKEAKRHNLNDPRQLADFYRKFDKATAEDWVDKLRYSSMLSSPLTHARNIFSNMVGGTVVHPIQKVFEGGVDAARAAITGTPRTRTAGEAGAYLKGFKENFGEAKAAFKGVMTNKAPIKNPDIDALYNLPLATTGIKGKLDSILSFTTKMMEAADQFGTALVRGGEMSALNLRASKGIKVGNIAQDAEDAATKRLFRADLGSKDQGHLLHAIDAVPQAVFKWRNADNPIVRTAAKFTFPFVKTPVNIAKQMIEYSPLGVVTTWGAADKTAQIAKATMGVSAVGLSAGIFAANDAITFSPPTNPKDKERFLAEGKQGYSIKIGDKWISYQYLHPAISFNLAAVGAVKQAIDSGKMDDNTAEKVLEGLASVNRFFVDQSYFKNAQDFLNNISGESQNKTVSSLAQQAANATTQLIPFRAAASWINGFVDQTQRKVDYSQDALSQFLQNIERQLPGLSSKLPARTDPEGNPLRTQHPAINAFSPARVSTDKGGSTKEFYKPPQPKEEKADTKGMSDAAKKGLTTVDKLKLPKGISKEHSDTLLQDARMTEEGRKKRSENSPEWEYSVEVAKLARDNLKGELSDAEIYRRQRKIKKLEAGKDTKKSIRSYYEMNKDDIYSLIDSRQDGQDIASQILEYDKKLKDAGVRKTLKFAKGLESRYGKETTKKSRKSTKVRLARSSSGRKRSGSRVARGRSKGVRLPSVPRISTSVRVPRLKAKKVRISKPKYARLAVKSKAPKIRIKA